MMKKDSQSKLIGLVTDPSPGLLVGLFGILKSGNGFVPITPSTPNERVGLIINDCRIETVVTESRYLDKILTVSKGSPCLRHIICLDAVENKQSPGDGVTVHDCAEFVRRDPAGMSTDSTPDEVLYVIFTSGSTGTPKGVPITHRNLAPLILWSEEYFKLGEHTRVLQDLSYGFDFGIFELLTTVLFGGTLYFADREDIGDLPRYAGYIEKYKINTIHTTPSSFKEIIHVDGRLSPLEKIHFGGEELTRDLIDEISRVTDGRCAIYNGYGPTEASINCAIFEVGGEAAADHKSLPSIPIGKATANSSLFVLDRYYQPAPLGVPGELHVGGGGLASSYLNSPELTAERFLPDPFSNRGGGRLYKTGDMVRYLPDGNILFMGRIDHQIKVRGFRIELGEIEAALRQHPSVNETVVIAREDEHGSKHLVAYVTTDGAQLSVGELRAFLKQKLPEYMVPSAVVTLDAIPVTPGGKVDRRALPTPEVSRRDLGETFVAPRTPEEETIASICAQLLGLKSLGVHDDLFNLGCHSLMATRIIARLREAFRVELPLITLFENPTVAGLAAEVARALHSAQRLEVLPIRPVPRDRDFPLSFAQERLWFLCNLDPNNTSYYIPRALRITGPFDVDVLERAFTELVRQHEILRTTFPLVDGRPVQLIHPPKPFMVSRVDLRGVPEGERESRVEQIILEQGQHPFDLEKDLLLRVVVLQLAELEYVMILTEHHLVHDGWTQGVLVRDFLEVYAAFASGKPSPLREPALQYADFAYWQRNWLKGEVLEAQLSYWAKQLAGAPSFLELPADRPRPAAQSFKGAEQTLIIGEELAESLRALSRQQGVTLFMTMFAAFNTLLYRYTSRDDILVGSGIANRRWSEIEGLLGMIINTLVLRTDLSGDPTSRELLQRVRAVCLQAYAHQDTPFEKVVEELKPERSLSYNPIFQVMFSFMDAPTRELELPGLTLNVINAHNRSAKFDLNIVIIPHAEQLMGQAAGAEHSEITVLWEYSTDIFDAPTIARMLCHFENILKAFVTNVEQRISQLPILTEAERRQLLVEWNDTGVAYPQDKCIHQLFELQAERLPDSVAVTSEDSQLTYLDLNRRANQLAHYLLGLGVSQAHPTAIYLGRSADIVVAILAVIKAGGAYLPLDPAYPPERLTFMLEDSRAPVLLTEQALLDRIPEHPSRVICLDTDWERISAESDENPDTRVSPGDAAYIIYTSGSTGKPKGVLVTHYNVARLFEATQPWFNFDERDTWTLFHSYSFDFSVWEIWGALLYGGRLVVVPYLVSRSPEAFYDLLLREHVTVLNQTPSAFRQLVLAEGSAGRADDLALRLVIFGGEALDLQSLRPWFERHGDERPQLVNMYGITETTVHVTYRPLSIEDSKRPFSSVIGRAIPDLQIYILDQNLEPAPLGVPGEIYVGGAGVARGYLNRPELNAQRFIANPFSEKPGERLYRSGDLARHLGDGDIEYVGRIDQQVKVRGFRIELGEIEAVLCAHAAVREAVVMMREDTPGEKRLVAYIVGGQEQAATVGELRDYLKQKLPEYMIPASFVMMDALPLTTHGKVDRRALPRFSTSSPEAGKNVVPPATLEEDVLADVWAQVLGIERVGTQDNFFDLGGDSILSIQVVTLARNRGLGLTLDQLFRHQTIQELARSLVADQRDLSALEQVPAFELVSPEDKPGLPEGIVDAYPLTELQAGMFFHSAYRPETAVYHNIASFHLEAPFDVDKLETALRELAGCHPVLRTAFDLTGFSEPLQIVYHSVRVPLQVDDLRHLDIEQQEKAIADWFEDEKSKKFDWGRAPLLRFHIHRRSEETFQLSLTEHHAILDGWSVASMLTELFRLYLSLLGADAPIRLQRPATTFAHYVALERRAAQSDEHRSFWAHRLSDCTLTELPRRHSPRQVSGDRALRQQEVPLPTELSEGLKRTARLAGAPLKSVLLAAHLRVLSLLAGQADVMTGLTTNGRPEASDAERALGLFLNTLPFRLEVSGGSWVELARKTFKAEQELLPFRRFPLAEIQRLMGGKPLVETAFNFVHFHVARGLSELEDLQVLGVKTFAETNFTLMVHFSQDISSSEINLRLDYDALKLDPGQAANFAHYYSRVLQAMAYEPLSGCDSVDLLPERERTRLLIEWNDTARDYPRGGTINQLFEAQAEASPDAIAIIFEDSRLTYEELNRRANRVAHFLKGSGIGPESRVGICAERSPEMLAGMLGILKAGGAYVPLDPAYPKERIGFMLEDSRASVLLTQERLLETLPQHAARIICLDRDWGEISRESDEDCVGGAEADSLAYVIYTSGSTGEPKGIGIQHRSAVTLLNWAAETFSAEDFAGTLASTSICFDLSVFELFAPLSLGGTVIMARDALELSSLRAANEVTLINTVPSAMAEIIMGGFLPRSARVVNLAGEPVQRSLVKRVYECNHVERVYNLYGPSEDTTYSTFSLISRGGNEAPDIGRPIANTQVYILDARLRPVPLSVIGEIYISGDGVARGYLGRPGLTAEKFLPNPFGDKAGGRLYKTGDLARYLPDGDIEFLGRIDYQVKIRGFRIELGEIEAVLNECPGVRESVVVSREDVPGDKRLVAYLVAQEGYDLVAGALRDSLREKLPDYMVPSAFVLLRALPLTPNGKLDRGALPAPDHSSLDRPSGFVAPSSLIEQTIASVWQQVLRIDELSIHDNFFDLGGHSLLLVRVHSKLRHLLKADLSIVDLFHYPSIKLLADHISASQDGRASSPPLAGAAGAALQGARPIKSGSEPLAIIAVAGQFPGARSVEEFWRNLSGGVESIKHFSKEELIEAGLDAALISGADYVRAAAVLDGVDMFDAAFFGLTPREAEITDPQHRLFLECAWEALERAGYEAEHSRKLIGVYSGVGLSSYLLSNLLANEELIESVGGFQMMLSNDRDFLPTRVSYKLNLKGPSLNVQTACSTSLVAVHLACKGLQNGECDLAIAGGVTIRVPQQRGYRYQRGGINSSDGHCRAFDARATGTVFGSGIGIVVLKRLAEAVEEGDNIIAVIRGSAINNDGSVKVGYTAPGLEGQAAVISEALRRAEVEPEQISYMEAHGTATALGDPIEVAALSEVYTRAGRAKQWCAIGSVKTNVGHLDAAAGVTGLIKAALALKHKQIPASLNFEQANPEIDFANSPFYVNTELRKWERQGGPLRAAVSSFGIGGTNAHVILEEAPQLPPPDEGKKWQLVVVSARTQQALEAARRRLGDHLESGEDAELADVAYTLAVGRKHFSQRAAVVCSSKQEAIAGLRARAGRSVIRGISSEAGREVIMMFSGQGAQYARMGAGLYRSYRVFREALDECSEMAGQELGVSVREVIFEQGKHSKEGAKLLEQTSVTQAALFAVEYAGVKLWESLGVRPTAMMGHSIGEYVAATVAGVMSLEEAVRLVSVRGKLMQKQRGGAMLAVMMSEEDVKKRLPDGVSIAAVNESRQVVVGGREQDVERVKEELRREGIVSRRLKTSHAFHSWMMEEAAREMEQEVRKVKLMEPKVRYISGVTGGWIKAEEAVSAQYWGRQMMEPVRWWEGVKEALKIEGGVMLEVGPGGSLTSMARREAGAGRVIESTIRREGEERDDEEKLMEAVGRMWAAGVNVDWRGVFEGERRRRVELPTYPFERHRFWIERRNGSHAGAAHRTLPGKRLDVADWLHLPYWKPSALIAAAPSDPPMRKLRWLVFMDGQGLGANLVERLKPHAESIVVVRAGEGFADPGDDVYTINPLRRDDFYTLIERLRTLGKIPDKIVQLWSLRPGNQPPLDPSRSDESQSACFYSLLFLAQALGKKNITDPLEIDVVTRNAQDVTGEDTLCCEGAMLSALSRVIPQEYSNLNCRNLDVAAAEPGSWQESKAIDSLLAELLLEPTDPVVAYRGNARWVRAYEPVKASKNEEGMTRLRRGGVYLITGGLGKIGFAFAEFLAESVGAKLILSGRSDLYRHDNQDAPSSKMMKVRALEKLGAEVLVVSADIASEEQMRGAIDQAMKRFGKINGVVHAAGAASWLRTIQELEEGECDSIFYPKVEGVRVLEKVLEGIELDFCFLMASLSAILGGLGMAANSAANGYMTAFARRHNRTSPVPWTCITWDGWQPAGESTQGISFGAAIAQLAITPKEGVEIFQRTLSLGAVDEVVVSTTDLQARLDKSVRPGSLRHAKQEGGAATLSTRAKPDSPDSYEAPRNRVEQIVLSLWQELLGIEDIGIHDDFFELGGQSLLATQLIARARASFGVDLPLRAFFTAPTIASLSDKIGEAIIAESDLSRIDKLLDQFERSEGQSLTSPGIEDSFN